MGSLTTKCQLALSGLFRNSPRVGWISGDQAVSSHLASEFARLSEENAKLRDQLARYNEDRKTDRDIEIAATRLRAPLIEEFRSITKRFRDRKSIIETDEVVAAVSNKSLLDFMLIESVLMMDGDDEDTIFDKLEEFLRGGSPASGKEFDDTIRRLAILVGILLGIWNLLEAYEMAIPGPRDQYTKYLRLSRLGDLLPLGSRM